MYSKWLALPLATRQAIAKELGIAKTGSTHVVDNRVQSDGYDIKTVEDALEAHEGDWDGIVAKAEGREPTVEKQLYDDKVGSVEIPKEVVDNTEQIIIVQAVNDAPKKKTTRAKPARRKGK